MSEIGSLIIRLQAETAQFRDDLGKVKNDLKGLGDSGGAAGGGIRAGMYEARGSLMLVEESVGVRLPRHLNNLIATIPGVGEAFAMMLPLAGVVAAVAVVAKLIERHEALENAIRKSAFEAAQSAVKNADQAKSIEITNLKLDDQIAKLEHKPAHNYMAEAILETSKDVDALLASYSTDMQKMTKLTEEQTGIWIEVWRGVKDAFSGVGQGQGYGTVTKQWDDLKQKMLDVQEAEGKLSTTDPFNKDATAAARQDVIQKLNAEKTALAGLQVIYRGNKDELLQLGTQYNAVNSELRNLNLTIEEGGKKQTVAGLQQKSENLKPLEDEVALQKILAQGVSAHETAVRKLAATQAEMATAGLSKEDSPQDRLATELAAIEKEKQDEIASAEEVLAAKRRMYTLDIQAAGGDAQKKKEIEAQYRNDIIAAGDAIAQADASAQRKAAASTAAAAEEERRRVVAEAQQEADDILNIALREAQDEQKIREQAARNEEALHRKTTQQIAAEESAAVRQRVNAEVIGYQQRIAALDAFDANYLKKVEQLQAKIVEATKRGEAQVTSIEQQAHQKQLKDIQQAENHMYEAVASNVAKSIVANQSLAQSMRQLGEEMVEGMVKNLIMMEITADKQKLIDAKKAFHNAMGDVPWPLNLVVAPAMFAATMAFEQGGEIPGTGAVPIIAHGGETVVTKALTERVEAQEGRGNKGETHLHIHNNLNASAIDAEGMDKVLVKHAATLKRHVEAQVRRMNR